MKKRENTDDFRIYPIGKYIKKESKSFLVIFPKYKPALKYLELFSHIVVFCEEKRDANIFHAHAGKDSYTAESNKLRNLIAKNNICISVARIINIGPKDGIIELDHSYAYDGAYIFDIKAYFPFEDRVKDVDVPDIIKRCSEWRPELIEANASSSEQISIMPVNEEVQRFTAAQIGVIKKTEGEYFLDLNGISADILNSFHGFSHLRIIWWFHRFDKKEYRKTTQCNPPYENAPTTGVFASRSPVRPNPIAMTTVRILKIDKQNKLIKVSDLDAFDKTPIIDIKPYIPMYDRVKEFHVPHWVSHWPEWTEERNTNHIINDISITSSDIERIREFMILENPSEKIVANIFKKEQSNTGINTTDIVIKGARQNNLKNVNASIPKNKITVVTGVSGSGKSSFAFDTVYAESQRRFMDSISTSGRVLFEQIEKPDVEQIIGLPPAIAIEQKTISRNPRSTVGTITDINDYMRLLFSKIGIRHCPDCGRAICPINIDEIVSILSKLRPNTEFSVRAFNDEEEIMSLLLPENGDISSERDALKKNIKECVEKGLKKSNGAIIATINKSEEILLQTKNMCYHCDRVFFELTAAIFSFNNPEGMCPVCNGLGIKLDVDPGLIVSRPELSILDGASEWWGNLRKHREKPNANWMKGEVLALAEEMKVDMELSWNELPDSFKQQALYGSIGKEVRFVYENSNGRKGEINRPVEGAFNCISRLFKENSGDTATRISKSFMREKECPLCMGERLSLEGRLVSIGGTRFPQTVGMTIEELIRWVSGLPGKLTNVEFKVVRQILNELNRRLQNLIDVGVQYLTLNRSAPTLSGGEAQRLRLATQLGCDLTNLLYILDEPSIGLHPKDQLLLLHALKNLRDAGNTILVVEHDPDIMLAADKIIDIGPGAGEYGGEVIAEGTPQDIMDNLDSKTGKYLKGDKSIGSTIRKIRNKPNDWIRIFGARHNNLKNINVSFPLGIFTCVTGVSGSGKSSIVSKTLYPALARFHNNSEDVPGEYSRIEGMEKIDKVINISQLPIGRSPRSNPATYTGVFDNIREFYASTEEAKRKGYKQNRFSFNSKVGQCATCGGEGRKCVQMHFMPDVWVECSLCHGKRFNEETLQVIYNGKSISDVLDMDVDEALQFFSNNPKIKRVLQMLQDVGLGYIKLGQSALTLSGGEAQRIKLAKELSKTDTGRTLYILDEPTTGLHFSDIRNLMDILHRITEEGNTVIVIEHNISVMETADWIIDIGPEGGSCGGYVVAQGTPEGVAGNESSYTGKILFV